MNKSSKRHIETAQLKASAYNDAVRDILHSDGVFHLVGDERRPDAVWQWDGVHWRKLPIDDLVDEQPGQAPLEREEGAAEMVAAG
jgi:hypothetical protein